MQSSLHVKQAQPVTLDTTRKSAPTQQRPYGSSTSNRRRHSVRVQEKDEHLHLLRFATAKGVFIGRDVIKHSPNLLSRDSGDKTKTFRGIEDDEYDHAMSATKTRGPCGPVTNSRPHGFSENHSSSPSAVYHKSRIRRAEAAIIRHKQLAHRSSDETYKCCPFATPIGLSRLPGDSICSVDRMAPVGTEDQEFAIVGRGHAEVSARQCCHPLEALVLIIRRAVQELQPLHGSQSLTCSLFPHFACGRPLSHRLWHVLLPHDERQNVTRQKHLGASRRGPRECLIAKAPAVVARAHQVGCEPDERAVLEVLEAGLVAVRHGAPTAKARAARRRRAMQTPLSFGLLTDVQAANRPSIPNSEDPNRTLRYDEATALLGEAIDFYNEFPSPLAFIIHLGDIVDGREDEEKTRADFEAVIAQFTRSSAPTIHVLGNHCVKFTPRAEACEMLSLPGGSDQIAYYRRELSANWRLLVLDTTDLSVHGGWPEDSPQFAAATEYMNAHAGEDRMKRWNGGLGKAQLEWLKSELEAAKDACCRVIVASHHCLARRLPRDPPRVEWRRGVRAASHTWPRRSLPCRPRPRRRLCVRQWRAACHIGGGAEAPIGSNAYAIATILTIVLRSVGGARASRVARCHCNHPLGPRWWRRRWKWPHLQQSRRLLLLRLM